MYPVCVFIPYVLVSNPPFRFSLNRVTFASRFSQRSMATVSRFTPEHEYIKYDDETNEAVIGITNHAQGELGDVVYVELPDEGSEFEKAEAFGSVESVKAASSIYAPVDCEVIEANAELEDAPNTINDDAEGAGWMIKVKVADASQLDALMDEAAYKAHCEE